MSSSHRRRWRELSPQSRALIVAAGTIQLGLLAAAQVDIRRRSADQLNGPRWLWIAVSFINFAGPITYFAIGRRKRVSP